MKSRVQDMITRVVEGEDPRIVADEAIEYPKYSIARENMVSGLEKLVKEFEKKVKNYEGNRYASSDSDKEAMDILYGDISDIRSLSNSISKGADRQSVSRILKDMDSQLRELLPQDILKWAY